MKHTPIPKRWRWQMRRGKIGFARFLLLEIKNYFKSDVSQFGEAQLINALLRNDSGFYVDIGSGRPITGSNTFKLYKRGWSGILVDPLPINKSLSKLIRPRDKFFQGLIGLQHLYTFYVIEPYAYSTVDESIMKQLLVNKGDAVKLSAVLDLQGISLKNLLQDFEVKEIDLLSVDVEGYDFQVLQSNDWTLFKPKIICVEILGTNSEEVATLLTQQGYELLETRGPSYIFKHKDFGGGGGI